MLKQKSFSYENTLNAILTNSKTYLVKAGQVFTTNFRYCHNYLQGRP